jgi:hypothetical protein
MLGPNVKRLICHYMATLAIPKGGGIADGIKFLMDKDKMASTVKDATEYIESAIAILRLKGSLAMMKK